MTPPGPHWERILPWLLRPEHHGITFGARYDLEKIVEKAYEDGRNDALETAALAQREQADKVDPPEDYGPQNIDPRLER